MHLVVTGFSSFPGVADNPTQHLIKFLVEGGAGCLPSHVKLHSCTVLPVSAQSVRMWLNQVFDTFTPQDVVLLVHLGVDAMCDGFKLEDTCYNNATFRVPDIDGYRPDHCLICQDESLPLDAPLHSNLALQQVKGVLSGSYPVEMSHDPGRYVCNWTYFLSLYHSLQRGATSASGGPKSHAVFVHVPLFECIGFEKQCTFLKQLLPALCSAVPQSCSADGFEDRAVEKTHTQSVDVGISVGNHVQGELGNGKFDGNGNGSGVDMGVVQGNGLSKDASASDCSTAVAIS